LNVGCGPASPLKLHAAFRTPEWIETRFDIEPSVRPDILGSIVDMAEIGSGTYDALWSSHNIEHIHTFEVPIALREFRRVLKDNGFTLITCPDIEPVAQLIVDGLLEEAAYVSPAGPITPLDMLFGHSASVARGHVSMAHNTGFTVDRLGKALVAAGFQEVRVVKGRGYDLWALAAVTTLDEAFAAIKDAAEGALFASDNAHPAAVWPTFVG
jgi:SAM-dependent methyltransferase